MTFSMTTADGQTEMKNAVMQALNKTLVKVTIRIILMLG
jgi:hypothetical protein